MYVEDLHAIPMPRTTLISTEPTTEKPASIKRNLWKGADLTGSLKQSELTLGDGKNLENEDNEETTDIRNLRNENSPPR